VYEYKINPLPHYAPAVEGGDLDFETVWGDVAGQWKLINDPPKRVVINRCWPPSLIEAIEAKKAEATRDAWLDSLEERIVEFKEAMEDIKDMMAAIEESPLYDFEVNDEPLLEMLHERMAIFTAYPPDPENFVYGERDKWVYSWDIEPMKEGQYPEKPVKTTPLIEFFFGYAPAPEDYTKPQGKVFPK
jgi:hypothetical protein